MAANRANTGRTEIGMLSDLQEIAEKVGREVLGFDIEWFVETSVKKTGKRPDVEIRRQGGARELIISGEAKRPEVPEGVHCFVASEVHGAIAKAKSLSVGYAFTTNFLDIAIFDASQHTAEDYLDALVAEEAIPWIAAKEAASESWWSALTKERRAAVARPGLERFFQQIRKLRAADESRPNINKDEVYLSIFKQSADSLVAGSVPALVDAYSTLSLPTGVMLEAARREFDLSKPDIVRYFVAQSVAEILTSGLFYQTVRPTFSLKPLLSGTRPATSKLLVEIIDKNLSEATRVTGDYETIFQLSEGAKWVLGIDSPPLRTQWIYLFEALSAVKFEEVTSDIIGVIFERLISADRRQDMGQHYTQARLARAMTEWGVSAAADRVVDFSAGGGTFLVEAYARLRHEASHEQVLQQVFGNDLDSFAVHLATVNLATRDVYKGHNFPAVSNRDAFDIRPGDAAVDVTPATGDAYRLDFPETFDVILGNPPYDEKAADHQQYRQALAELAAKNGGSLVLKGIRDDINLAAWFILLAAAWSHAETRIALVLPASILQNEKHASLLYWVRSLFDITVWHTESDVWFSDARVAPVVLFMQRKKVTDGNPGTFQFVNIHEPVSGTLSEDRAFPQPVGNITSIDLGELPAESDAIIAGNRPESLRNFEVAPNVIRLATIGNVQSGNKLGHDFYRLKDMDRKSGALIRTLRGFEIPTKLHNKYLTPFLNSPKDEPTGEFHPSTAPWYVLKAPAVLPVGGELQKYVRAVTRTNANDAPSVRNRGNTWWSVPWKTSQIAIAIHPQFQHQMWWCDEPFVAKNNMHTVTFASSMSAVHQEVVAASLASAFGALSALYRSNEVGCEGVRWLSTAQLQNWLVLDPAAIDDEMVTPLLAAYRTYRVLKTAKVHEMPSTALKAWRALTVAVARAAGVDDSEAAADAALRDAHDTTLRRREREVIATAGRTRVGSSGGGKLARDIKLFTETHVLFREGVALLSDGEKLVRLRTKETTEVSLFDLDGETLQQSVTNDLAVLLGEGFEAAPVWGDEVVEVAVGLLQAVRNHFIEPTESEGPDGFQQVKALIDDAVVKSLQASVKKRLS